MGWTGAPARHRRPGEDRRGGHAFSTVVRRGTARESSYHRRHCSPKGRLAKGGGMREFTTRCSTACASVRIRFKEMAPFFFRVLEPSAPTTLTSWGRLPVRTPTTVTSHDSRTPVSGGRASSGSAVDGRGETPSPLPSRGGVRMDADDRRWRRGRAVECAYNLSLHGTTGLAPFQSLYGEGRHPAHESYIPGTSRPSQAGARLP